MFSEPQVSTPGRVVEESSSEALLVVDTEAD